jgi:cytochrome c6
LRLKEGGEMKAIVLNLMRWVALLVFLSAFSRLASAQSGTVSSPGGKLFNAKCTMCHGLDGAGKTMMGEKLKIPDLRSEDVQKQSDAQLKEVITNGKAKMPAFKGKLMPEQVGQLVVEIRDLSKTK